MSSSGSGEQYRPPRPAPAEQHLGDRLAAFVDGELTDDSRDRVLAHLATCTQCKAAATEQRRLKSVVAGSELPAISAGLLARLQGLPAMDGQDGPGGPGRPSGLSADEAGDAGVTGGLGHIGHRRGPFDGGFFGSRPTLPDSVLSDPGRSGPDRSHPARSGGAARREEFSFLGPAADLVPSGDGRGRGFRIHDSTSRGRRFAFAAAGAFSMAAIAIGSALPMEAAMDSGARPDDGPAVSPLSAGQVSDTRGSIPRGVLGADSEDRRQRRDPIVAASATSVPLIVPVQDTSDRSFVLH
ncbi:Putative zinc-finger [Actinacidiphila yanglinensis]|uniref:Putative zinc-finger n=1 Tax=Actinacidiphila yanglinensis TaxID=310779 RepID=A0A1H5V6G8_9ACTN|nr:zf-HC2 domain-containing protein [Actinacidiphila yanglinensis]SEF83002.1 Putative zinc-finger [Actinacidiphila yanglinensis]